MRDPGEHLDALIAAERGVTPPAGAGDAAWTDLQARLELAAGAPAAAGGLVKLIGAVALGVTVAAGVAALARDEPTSPPAAPAPDRPAVLPVPGDIPAAPPPDHPAVLSVPRDTPEAPAPPTPQDPDAPEPVPGDTWSAELATLRDIHAALRDGRATEARALADEYLRRRPRGEFREEVEAARVLGLCAEDPGPATRRALAAFERRWPASLYAERLRQRCGS